MAHFLHATQEVTGLLKVQYAHKGAASVCKSRPDTDNEQQHYLFSCSMYLMLANPRLFYCVTSMLCSTFLEVYGVYGTCHHEVLFYLSSCV